MRNALAAALVIPLAGCLFGGSSIEGTWKSDYRVLGTLQDEFTLDSTDGNVTTGTGTFYDGSTPCEAEVEVRRCDKDEKPAGDCPPNPTDQQYTLRMHPVASGRCPTVSDLADAECFLSDDEKSLDCRYIGKYLKQE